VIGVASPCTQICLLDPANQYCRGCWRSLDEITSWPRLGDAEKRRILAAAVARRDTLSPPS
jgi:predicted Fe-S protein YdhL (DUF1289 family)